MNLENVTKLNVVKAYRSEVEPLLLQIVEICEREGIPFAACTTTQVSDEGVGTAVHVIAPPGTNLPPVQGAANMILSMGVGTSETMLRALFSCISIIVRPDGDFYVETVEETMERDKASCAGSA